MGRQEIVNAELAQCFPLQSAEVWRCAMYWGWCVLVQLPSILAQHIPITFEHKHIEDGQLHLHTPAFHLQLTWFSSFDLILTSVWEFLNIGPMVSTVFCLVASRHHISCDFFLTSWRKIWWIGSVAWILLGMRGEDIQEHVLDKTWRVTSWPF